MLEQFLGEIVKFYDCYLCIFTVYSYLLRELLSPLANAAVQFTNFSSASGYLIGILPENVQIYLKKVWIY